MKSQPVSVLDLARELRRLANSVVRDAQKDSELACLSHIVAIRPLTQLLFEVLSPSEISDTNRDELAVTKNPIGFVRPEPQNTSH